MKFPTVLNPGTYKTQYKRENVTCNLRRDGIK